MSFQVVNSYHISRMYKLFLALFSETFFPGFICGSDEVVFDGNYLWVFLLRYSQQMSPLPSHTRRRLQQLHQRCLPECKFLARTCLPVLALKSFWSCCRYVIEWVFLLSFSYIVSLSLWRSHSRVIGGKMPSSLLRCRCQTPLSISGEWFMTRIPTALLCWMKSRRQMKYAFYSFFKIRKVTDQEIIFSLFLSHELRISWKIKTK